MYTVCYKPCIVSVMQCFLYDIQFIPHLNCRLDKWQRGVWVVREVNMKLPLAVEASVADELRTWLALELEQLNDASSTK